jgi:succinate dehydrogenase/fumarate reductase cytochrome b subunit
METKEKKSLTYYARYLHRNIGFFIIGFTLIYSLSGIVLIYRDSDFMKAEKTVKLNLKPGLKDSELGQALRMREFKVTETRGDLILFQGGSYNSSTGETVNTVKELVFPFNKLTNLHKTPSKNIIHWFNLFFGISLLFMAVSSFWMFNSRSKLFRNGIYVIVAGVVVAFALLFFIG